MRLNFNRNHFLISFGILSIGWLLINYIFFASKGKLAFHSDFLSILTWAWEGKQDYIKTFGIYMPVIPYIVSIYSLFYSSLESMVANATYLKSFFIFVDAVTFAWIISLLPLKSVKLVAFLSLLSLANIALIYNSIFWGQVDSLHSLLVFSCFVTLIQSKYKYVWGLFIIAVLTKIVSVIFLPIILLVILNELICKRLTIRQILVDISVVPVIALIIFLPILLTGNLSAYVELTNKVMTEYDSVTSNAFNVYYLISNRTDLIGISSQTPLFRSLTYNQFGLAAFSLSFFICLFPAFKTLYLNIIGKKGIQISNRDLLFIFVLTPLLFFFFTTKIRERFSHPYLIFLTLYCFYNRRYIFWYLATFIYFLQLESVLEYTRVHGGIFTSLLDETNIYKPEFVASLFLVLIIYLLHLMFMKLPRKIIQEPPL